MKGGRLSVHGFCSLSPVKRFHRRQGGVIRHVAVAGRQKTMQSSGRIVDLSTGNGHAHSDRTVKMPPARQQPSQRRCAPPADLGALQPQPKWAQQRPDPYLFDPQRGANLPRQPLEQPLLGDRPVPGLQHLTHLLDQLARTAQIDRSQPALLAVAQEVVRAERFATAAVKRGPQVSLPGEQIGAGGDRFQGRVGQLVSRLAIFQFWTGVRVQDAQGRTNGAAGLRARARRAAFGSVACQKRAIWLCVRRAWA